MEESILRSVAKALGIPAPYEYFDPDLILHINTILSVLVQLGAIDEDIDYLILDDQKTWRDVLRGSQLMSLAFSYMVIRVGLLFDPQQAAAVLDAKQKTADELAQRITWAAEKLDKDGENG